ncbi:MAG: polyprenyl synthetase family protein [FCB group bacterium]|nr:polyprenyl synthetase family protein [FCB group bacterium]
MRQATDLSSFQEHIRNLQAEINEGLRTLSLADRPDYLYTPVKYVLKGTGKRLRPILVHLVGETFSADPEDLLHAGLAVELLHNFTLVHDDIMDADSTRHGQPTVHEKWDESTAILAGDGIYALGQLLISRVKINTLQAIQAFNIATLMVCEGQAYDKEFEHDHNISLDQYFTMIEKKTGWLIGLCAEIGGILGDQNEEVRSHLRSYGLNLGKVFQIQDDILEVYGNEKSMGKSLGSDLVAGKQTVLTVLARELFPAEWAGYWQKIQQLEIDKALSELRGYLEEKKILQRAKELVDTYNERAREDLKSALGERRHILMEFTDMVVNRKK